MENKLPERKATHLKNYDYSKTGVYFVTICTEDRKQILSNIVWKSFDAPENEKAAKTKRLQKSHSITTVGELLAAPENERLNSNENSKAQSAFSNNYKTRLTHIGKIAEEQILNLENRYDTVKIKNYVIMPDHIHLLIFLRMEEGAASGSPTLHNVVRAFKSLTSRECKNKFGIEKIFQRSFSEHIIRDREDYDVRMKYIHENQMRWYYKEKRNEKE